MSAHPFRVCEIHDVDVATGVEKNAENMELIVLSGEGVEDVAIWLAAVGEEEEEAVGDGDDGGHDEDTMSIGGGNEEVATWSTGADDSR